MMKKEHRVYFELGKSVLLALVVVLALPLLWPLHYQTNSDDRGVDPGCQPTTIPGVEMKNGLSSVDRALYAIKKNDGLLMMGTSETGSFGARNYWGILNKDQRMKHPLTVLSGAGRTCHVYFPLMLTHPEAFRGLRAIYFINPIYWAKGLNENRKDYFDRYNSSALVQMAASEASERGLYDRFLKPGGGKGSAMTGRWSNRMDLWRSYYYLDLPVLLDDLRGKNLDSLDCLEVQKGPFNYADSNQLKGLRGMQFLEDNISQAFKEEHKSKYVEMFPDSTFQYEALSAFILLTKELEMDITYFFGPYNAIYAQKYSPESAVQFEGAIEKIRKLLEGHEVEYIDGTSLSYEAGTFNDLQHHSRYGGWKIAELIAKHYEKRKK